jgi:hypothetical protein
MLLGVKDGFHGYLDPSHDPMAVSSEDDFPIDHVVRVWEWVSERNPRMSQRVSTRSERIRVEHLKEESQYPPSMLPSLGAFAWAPSMSFSK